MKRMARRFAAALAVAALCLPLAAHLPLMKRANNAPVPYRWSQNAFPVQWNLNTARGSNIVGDRSVENVVQVAFATWQAAPNSLFAVARGSNTSQRDGFNSSSSNNQNVICFTCAGEFADESETVAVTLVTTANGSGGGDGHGGTTQFAGQILDADILFNPNRPFFTDGAGEFDLETVALHEIGHFLGLDHTGVVRAVMFPFTPVSMRTLGYDDVAGISSLYPKPTPDVPLGSVSGSVSLGGNPVFGAHIYVDSVSDAQPLSPFAIRKTPISTFSRPDGTYTITGVPSDSYIVIAEPLNEPATNGDISGYAPASGRSVVQVNFTTRWH
jgi:hypothetical protein